MDPTLTTMTSADENEQLVQEIVGNVLSESIKDEQDEEEMIDSPNALDCETKLVPTSDEDALQKEFSAVIINSGDATADGGDSTDAAPTTFDAVILPPVPTVAGHQQAEHQLDQHHQQAELCGAEPEQQQHNELETNRESAEDETIVSPTALETKLVLTSDEDEQKEFNVNLGNTTAASADGLTAAALDTIVTVDGSTAVAPTTFDAVTPPPVPTVVGHQQAEHQLDQHHQQAELCGAKTVQQQHNEVEINRESAEDETDASFVRQPGRAKTVQQQHNEVETNRESAEDEPDASFVRQPGRAKDGAELSSGGKAHGGGAKAAETKAKTKLCSIL